MKTFASKEKRQMPATRTSHHYVHHPMGPVQKAQQSDMRKILRPDEVQGNSDIGENDGNYGQESDHVADRVAAYLPVPAISGMPAGSLGGIASLQRAEGEEPEEEEPIQAKMIQRQSDNEEEEEPVQARRIQRQMADMRGIRPARFGYVAPEAKAQRAEIRRILRSTGAQGKLTIGEPNDKYEQEADRVADEVMRKPELNVQLQADTEEEEELIQTKVLNDGEVKRREESLYEEEEIQTKNTSNTSLLVIGGKENQIQSLQDGGQPLSRPERAFFEPRFGIDFSKVRMHSDSGAAHIARAINARAFTLGNDVVFNAGEYAPGAHNERKLVAHELTHVVQQNGGDSKSLKMAPKPVKRLHSLLGMTQKSQSKTPDIQRWLASEHTAIGDESYKAFSNFQTTTLTSERFNVGGIDMSYGKLAAMADFFEKYAVMLSGKKENLAELSRLVDLEGILGVKQTSKSFTMDFLYHAATEGRYLRLALKNFTHFTYPKGEESNKTPANVYAWKSDHERALNKVNKARKLNSKGKGGEAIKLLSEAMSVNAYADHFISDAFASGHLVTPRQLVSWPTKAGDIHDHFNELGFKVRNKKGEEWFALGDGYYADDGNTENKKHVIDTVRSSISDVIKLWRGTGKTAPPYDAEDMAPIEQCSVKGVYPGDASVGQEIARLVAKIPVIGPGMEAFVVQVGGHASVDNMIRKWVSQRSNAQLKALGSKEKAILIGYLLEGPTLDADEVAINTLLSNSTPWGAVLAIKKTGYERIASDIHGAEYAQFLQILVKQYAKTNRGQTKVIVEHWLRGVTGDREENAIVDLLRELSPVDVDHIISKIGFEEFDDNIHGDEYERFMGVVIQMYGQLSETRKVYIIKALSRGRTTEDEEEAIIGVLEAGHKAGEFCAIVSAVGKGRLYSELTGAEEDRFEELLKSCRK